MAQEESSVTADLDPSARILAEILHRLEEAGEPVTISAARLATTMGIPVSAFRLKINGLFAEGRLIKLSSGLAGTRIAAPGMADPGDAVEASEPAVGAPSAPAEPSLDATPAETADPGASWRCGCEEDKPSADTSSPATSVSATPASIREALHAHIQEAVGAAGGEVTTTMAHLASVVGTSVNTATYHVRALADRGHISISSKGRLGTAIRLGPGASAPKNVVPPSKALPTTARVFCPWCGTKISHLGWKFCHSCGEKLAQ